MTKMTYANAIDDVLALVAEMNGDTITFHDDDLGTSHDRNLNEVREKLNALKVQLKKRNSDERKPTKTQRENEGIKEQIMSTLSDEPMTIGELNAAMGTGYSPQKLSALLRQLVLEGKAIKDTVGKVPYFALSE